MRRRVLSVSRGLFVFALALVLASAAAAQQATAISIPNYSAEIGELLRRGRQLEIDQRWGEAFSHYEDAVRQFPLDDSLQRRFDFTRLHYDLGRRYADHSFRESVATLPLDGACVPASIIAFRSSSGMGSALYSRTLVLPVMQSMACMG